MNLCYLFNRTSYKTIPVDNLNKCIYFIYNT